VGRMPPTFQRFGFSLRIKFKLVPLPQAYISVFFFFFFFLLFFFFFFLFFAKFTHDMQAFK
jgi:hypothetical protein